MRFVILALSVLSQFPIIANGETLRGVWHVTTTECGGEAIDFLSISESINGGPVSATHHLDSIEIKKRDMTFLVGGHSLEATTSGWTRGEKGRFKIRLLGKDRDAMWIVDGGGLTLSILGVEEQPVVVKATRQQPPKTGRTKR